MTQSANSADKTSPQPSTRRRSWLLVVIFRVLLLGVGGGLALILGIVVANIYPRPQPELPLILKIQSYFDKQLKSVPPETSPTAVLESAPDLLQLNPVQRQEVQAQIIQLQGQLKTLNEKVTSLETQLGTSRTNDSLERRVQAISLQLQGVKPPNATETNGTNQTASGDAIRLSKKLKIVLPSDVLFEGNNSILRPEAGLVLDQIIADLRNYSTSTIRIAGYTDATGEVEDNRELSFRRAQTVEQYFTRALGEKYRWLVVGYGATSPIVPNDTDANQQRNRRIEISVD